MTGENTEKIVVPSGVNLSPIPVPGMVDVTALNRTINAQEKLGQAQTRSQTTDQALRDLNAGTDADFVQTDDRFEAWTHQEIYEAVNGVRGMDAAGLQTLRKVWFDAYSDLSNLSTFNQLSINRLLGHGEWAGASGDAARDASITFGRAANQISQVFSAMADRTDAVAWAAEATKAAVPAAVTFSMSLNPDDPVSSIIPGLPNPATVTQNREASEQARLAVISVMNQIYKPSFPPAGSGVPSYADVTGIVSPNDGTSAAGTTGSPSTNGGSDSPSNGSPSDAESPTTDISANTDTPTSTDLNSDEDDSTAAASSTPSATTPSTTTPTTNLAGVQTSPSPLGATGAPIGGGTPHLSTGAGGGRGSAGTPSLGMPLAGTPSNLTAGQGASAGAGARAGGAGALGPMMPGGASRKAEDDAEHRSPEYLRRVQSDWTAGITALNGGVIGSDGLPPAPVSRDRPIPVPAVDPRASQTAPTPTEAPVHTPQAESTPAQHQAATPAVAPSGDQATEMARLIAQYGWANSGQTSPDASAK
ncbi:hypothetical protein ACFWUP_27460 [Nocardia sp. NPDC058658]|uniref:hypothetical protein n=1 Tax=Nocardia sp. NPDC058658 TaxID=3346580 RepID=UPI003652DC5C